MKKSTLVKKMAKPAGIIFALAILFFIAYIPVKRIMIKKTVRDLEIRIEEIKTENKAWLKSIASEINSVNVPAKIISDINSRILDQYPKLKLYVWMSDTEGDFIVGLPQNAFSRLNTGFDKYDPIIMSDGYYMSRNDFLSKMIHHYDEIDFNGFESKQIEKGKQQFSVRKYNAEWELYRKWNGSYQSRYYRRPRTLLLSTPVIDESGQGIGELYLKIDDSMQHAMYKTDYYLSRQTNILNEFFVPVFRVLAIVSGLFLWFLMPTWIYIDAEQRGVKNKGMWAFVSVVSFGLGLVIYLVTRPQSLKSFYCPQCEKELNGTRAFCPHCGYDLAGLYCVECQYPIKENWQFCPNCRAGVKRKIDGADDAPQINGSGEQVKELVSPDE